MDHARNLKVPMLMGTNRDEGVFFAGRLTNPQPGATTTRPNSPGVPTPDLSRPIGYAGLLGVLFGPTNAVKIQKNSRYSCSAAPCTTPLANVITDSMFTCPNRQLAIQAGSTQNLYMYLFTQASSFNLWGPSNPISVPACQDKVCHGDEIPYVFNTAWAIDQTFLPAEETLSQTVGGYWASFAKSQSPGNAWPLFTPNQTYMLLNEKSSIANDPPNVAIANCTLWDSIGYQNSATWNRLLAEVNPSKKKPAH
jgi:carboxylesterase type B